ncbi:SulP family inorganic anion transporter [Nitrospinae bacterium]|nr:SulP family inorganic anion transporter [Nitrospinota bacterium]
MSNTNNNTDTPKGNIQGFKTSAKDDFVSGFLVFLIALPLCLGISLASGYPAIAGIITAIVGGLVATFVSDSELTIKGPAAGLIVIALGCVTEFGYTGGDDLEQDFQAYRLALGVGVGAGVVQILFGVLRIGSLTEFFPKAAIHGLLAAIGIIIIAKQLPILLGLHPHGSPLSLIARIPSFITDMNPKVAFIGALSIMIVVSYVFIKNKKFKIIPAPMMMLVITVPLGIFMGLGGRTSYTFNGKTFELGEKFLVNVPLDVINDLTLPDFSGLFTETGIKYIILFSIIGALESLLSAKAIDEIDPWHRKTNMDRDMLGIGVGNTVSAFLGGLPMISEIVRSKANIDNGAKTRFSNFYHGMFLLFAVTLISSWINHIPLAALAALLVVTGFRLASPNEFKHMYALGKDQFLIFITTIIAVLETDLLKGIGIGIALNIVLHLIRGVSMISFFRLNAEVEEESDQFIKIILRDSIIFSTWLSLRKRIYHAYKLNKRVTIDFSETVLVDSHVQSKLDEWEKEFDIKGLELSISGLDLHKKSGAVLVKRK